MPIELQNLDEADKTAIKMWTGKIEGAENEGMEFTKATQKIVKKTTVDSEQIVVPKKACVCAPTDHAGSFRCRLHRNASRSKPLCSGVEMNSRPKSNSKSMKIRQSMVDDQPQLSRFGRLAASGMPASEVSVSSKVGVNNDVQDMFC